MSKYQPVEKRKRFTLYGLSISQRLRAIAECVGEGIGARIDDFELLFRLHLDLINSGSGPWYDQSILA